MASPNAYHSSGGSTSTGVGLAGRAFLTSGKVYYVSSSTGSNTYSGLNRTAPVATLNYAHDTLASAGDIIWLLDGHNETIGTAQSFNKANIKVYAEGTARFTASAAIAMFDVTAAGVWFYGLTFLASTTTPTARIRIASTAGIISNCTFYSNTIDTAPAVKYITSAGQCRIESSSFISSATAANALPTIGVEVANAMSDLELRNVTFNGGTFGWSDYAFKGTAAITRVYGQELSFLNDSDWFFATGSSGAWEIPTASGSARGVWTA